MKESVVVVQGPGNWKVVVVKKNDYSIAALKSSLNSRPTHSPDTESSQLPSESGRK